MNSDKNRATKALEQTKKDNSVSAELINFFKITDPSIIPQLRLDKLGFRFNRSAQLEDEIALNADTAFEYLKEVLKVMMPELDLRTICGDPKLRQKYRLDKLVNTIANSNRAGGFASDILDARWPEAEDTILRHSRSAFAYAANFGFEDWFEEVRDKAEEAIMTDPKAAALYASSFKKGRWPEAEETILTDPVAISYYMSFATGKRWPEGEAVILQKRDIEAIYNVSKHVIKDIWPEGDAIIESGDFTSETNFLMDFHKRQYYAWKDSLTKKDG